MTKSISESSAAILSGSHEQEPVKILHVDDDPCFLKVAKRCLEMQGRFQVETASSVEEAIKKMKGKRYDAIVSDYQMPEKDGLQFLEELRKKGNNIPFIMFTGKGREEIAIKALNLGAGHYLSKTGDPETVYSELSHDITNMVKTRRAEQELRIQKEELQTILDSLPLQIWYKGKDNRLIRVNKRFAEYMGLSKKELEGKPLGDLYPPDIARKCWEEDKEVIETGQPRVDILDRHESAQGSRWFLTSKIPYKDREGKIIGTINFSSDITERKEAETSSTDHALLESIVESSDDAIIGKTLDGTIVSWNSGAQKTYGYAPEEVIGKSVSILVPPETQEEIPKILDKIKRGEHVDRYTTKRLKKDHSRIDVSITVSPIKDRKGNIIGASTIARDITEREKVQERLNNSEEKYRELFETSIDAIATSDMSGHFVDCNQSCLKMLGYTLDEMRNMTYQQLTPEKWHRKEAEIIEKDVMQKGYTSEYEKEQIRKDGTVIPVSNRVWATFDENGKPKAMWGIVRDITERKTAERELLISKNAMASAIDGMVIADLHGKVTYANPAFVKMWGYESDREIAGKSIAEMTQKGQSKEKTDEIIKALRTKGGWTGEINATRKDGSEFLAILSTSLVKDEADKAICMLSSFVDITERKKVETLVLYSQQRFQSLFSNNPEATVYTDVDFMVVDINRRFTTLFGYSSNEVKGKNINDLIVPKGHVEEAEMLDRKAMEGYAHRDTVRMRKDKSQVFVSISSAPIIVQGQLEGYVSVYKDISQLKKAEEELHKAMEKVQVTNEKLRVVGSLTRHDVRNKLTAVTGNTYLARKKFPENSDVLEYLGQIEASAEQTVKVLEFAKTYEMIGVEQMDFVDVEKTFNEAISLFSDLKKVKVMNNCQGLTVMADSLLRQLFYNLIDDSLKHGKKLTWIKIHCEEKTDHLNIIYEDDGVGIPASEKPKLFKEGYSTGGSTGYGLYLIKKMTEVYGWTIKENGEAGTGAVFVMTIPKTSESRRINYKLLSFPKQMPRADAHKKDATI